jgi:hypothetical protein
MLSPYVFSFKFTDRVTQVLYDTGDFGVAVTELDKRGIKCGVQS